MAEPLWQPRSDGAARLLGLGFFVGGSALLIYQAGVIHAALSAHAERISYFLAAIALGEMAVILGLYWLVRGLAGYTAVRTMQTDPRRMRILMITSAITIFITWAGLKQWLGSFGYSD